MGSAFILFQMIPSIIVFLFVTRERTGCKGDGDGIHGCIFEGSYGGGRRVIGTGFTCVLLPLLPWTLYMAAADRMGWQGRGKGGHGKHVHWTCSG